jgi:hypothetical protein
MGWEFFVETLVFFYGVVYVDVWNFELGVDGLVGYIKGLI